MRLTSFLKKWNMKSIEDWHTGVSDEFKTFVKDFRGMLKTELPDCDVKIHSGHYFVSGYVSRGNRHVYVSYDVPRMELPMDLNRKDALGGIMYRTAESTNDFHGGTNHFCTMAMLPKNVNTLLEGGRVSLW